MAGPVFALKLDTTQWERSLSALASRGPIAIARGINKSATSGRAIMAREVARDMGVKVGDARGAMTIQRASGQNLTARIIARGKRLPLIDFKARGPSPSRGRGRGVAYTMRGQRVRIADAFLATMPTGHKGVFTRRTKAGTPSRRLPIRELFGPSIAQSFGNLIPLGHARIADVLVKNVQHEVEFELSRLATT